MLFSAIKVFRAACTLHSPVTLQTHLVHMYLLLIKNMKLVEKRIAQKHDK